MEITLEDVQDPSRGMITLVEEKNALMVEVMTMVDMGWDVKQRSPWPCVMEQAPSYIN